MEITATKPKLLLADDSVTIRKVVEMTFAEEDIEVFTVSDGESAMLKFVETQPDIVLAHIGLSETNGYQICEMIKQDETTRHIPVLLLTGSFEPFDEAEAKRVKADGYLTKPFTSVRDVVARVKDLLGHAPTPEVAEPENDDIDDLYKNSFSKTAEIDEFETMDDSFTSERFDDEMIEAVQPAFASVENIVASPQTAMTTEQVNEFDWSPDAIVTSSVPLEAASTQPDANTFTDNGDASSTSVGLVAAPEISELERVVDDIEEPSAEFIELVARRVVEKLSDETVREIAQQEVPRIAEKLMREALGQNKTN